MKILFLYMFPLWGNGSGSFLRELAGELARRDHEVAIIAPDKRTLSKVEHYIVYPPQMGVFSAHPELPKAKAYGDMSGKELAHIYVSYLKTTIEAVMEFKPDVLHVFHTAFLPEIGRIIRALYGTKFIITTHGSDLAYMVKDRRLLPLVSDANKSARSITACSDFTKEWYLQIFGRDIKRKTSVIVGGVNLSHFKRDPGEIKKINDKYKLHDKKVVLFTGRLTKHKGVLYLIRAASAIKGTIVVIGDGPERKTIEEEIKSKKLTNVVMVGYVNSAELQFHAFYERADVCVSPSVWDEPLGLSILEAMASRTPVVATRKGGVLSMITDKVNGLLVPARNSKEMAKMINLLLENDEMRLKMGEQAHKTVVEKFSWEKIADRFVKLYEDAKGKEKYDAGPLDELVTKIFFGQQPNK